MAMNDRSHISGDYLAESGLGTTSIVMEADGISMTDGAIRIDLRGLDKEWFISSKVSKIKINDATFSLEGKK